MINEKKRAPNSNTIILKIINMPTHNKYFNNDFFLNYNDLNFYFYD